MNDKNTNNQTILIVEDNPDDVLLILRAFKKNNMDNKVVVTNDGVEALDYYSVRANTLTAIRV